MRSCPSSNRKEQSAWRKDAVAFAQNNQLVVPTFNVMTRPYGVKIFDYFFDLIASKMDKNDDMWNYSPDEIEVIQAITEDRYNKVVCDIKEEVKLVDIISKNIKSVSEYLLCRVITDFEFMQMVYNINGSLLDLPYSVYKLVQI